MRLRVIWGTSSYDIFIRTMLSKPYGSAARITDARGPVLRRFSRHSFGRNQSDDNKNGCQCDQLDFPVVGGVFSETDVAEVRFELAPGTV